MTAILWTSWISLKRDRVALLLTFVLPVVFFSIFVGIFGGMTRGDGMNRIKLAVVDDDRTDVSRRFITALSADAGLRVFLEQGDPPMPITRAIIGEMIKEDQVAVGLIIPPGFGEHFPSWDGQGPAVEVLADEQRNPVAPQVVMGLMQKAAMTGAPDLMIERGLRQFDRYAGGLTAEQRQAMDRWLPLLREQASAPAAASADNEASDTPALGGLVRTEIVSVHSHQRSDSETLVSFQVAQTAVMFLLFSMAGAAGSLLEEQENGTLDRLLSSTIGMTGLLAGKWLFITLMGVAQLAVMFLWAWKPFGLTLFTAHHLGGWAVMSVATAAAGAAFGLLLATLCRSRAQLSGLSTIIILIMSAVGGSMFPRFLMSETLQRIGLATFNGWALDGYRKVFYDQEPLWRLWPQVMVLAGMACVFMFIARRLAARWETA